MSEISGWTLETARATLEEFRQRRPDVDVHTVTIIMNDGRPQLTIVGTDQELDEVSVEGPL